MLNEVALQLASDDPASLGDFGRALFFVAFLIALVIRNRVPDELQRVPYFALSSLLFLIGCALSYTWLSVFQAEALGLLWLLIGANFLAIAILGYCYGRLALARARDAFGAAAFGLLAIVPPANFWLLLRPSKRLISPNRPPTIAALAGARGAATGIAMLGAGAGLLWDSVLRAEAVLRAEYQRDELAMLIRIQGLEETLRLVAAGAQLPVAVDEVTTLILVEAKGPRLARTFVVARDGVVFGAEFRSRIEAADCGHAAFATLMRGGAIIEETYTTADGFVIGRHAVTREACGP